MTASRVASLLKWCVCVPLVVVVSLKLFSDLEEPLLLDLNACLSVDAAETWLHRTYSYLQSNTPPPTLHPAPASSLAERTENMPPCLEAQKCHMLRKTWSDIPPANKSTVKWTSYCNFKFLFCSFIIHIIVLKLHWYQNLSVGHQRCIHCCYSTKWSVADWTDIIPADMSSHTHHKLCSFL